MPILDAMPSYADNYCAVLALPLPAQDRILKDLRGFANTWGVWGMTGCPFSASNSARPELSTPKCVGQLDSGNH